MEPNVTVRPAARFVYLDHIKVALTALVILHHVMITYGAPGSWYFMQPTSNKIALIPMTVVVATNQSFFMAMFFMLSSFFIEPSYRRKGAAVFLKDRLKRLGIPLVFYSFLLSPCMNFLVYKYGNGKSATFLQYLAGYDSWINFGVLWFVAALLVFTGVYMLLKSLIRTPIQVSLPRPGALLLFAALLGIFTFVVRLAFPIGWTLEPLGFQLAHFPQYISFFTIGILAWKNNWLDQLTPQQGRFFAWVAAALVLLVFPAIFVISMALHVTLAEFSGGMNWASFTYSVWEQLSGFSIIFALLGIGKQRWNTPDPLMEKASRAAFATYIFHPAVVIILSLLLAAQPFEPLIKLAIVAPLSIVGSFLLAGVLVKIPGVRDIV